MTARGPKWFVSTEPFGPSHGIFKIFLVDARTGEIDLYSLPEKEALTGPVRAIDYVRRSNPVVDWSRFDLVEPLPIIHKGTLFWKLAVIPSDAAGIAYQAFVNSRTNDVTSLATDDEIVRFVRGEDVAPAPGTLPGDQRVGRLEKTDGVATHRIPTDQLIDKIRSQIEQLNQLVDELERRVASTTQPETR